MLPKFCPGAFLFFGLLSICGVVMMGRPGKKRLTTRTSFFESGVRKRCYFPRINMRVAHEPRKIDIYLVFEFRYREMQYSVPMITPHSVMLKIADELHKKAITVCTK